MTWGKYGYAKESDAPPNSLIWKRPKDMGQGYTKYPTLWGSVGKPIPNGIAQRSLGDCWFLASAAALAEKPGRIYNLFYNRGYNRHGAFRVRFFVKDRWYWINVDDRLPSTTWGSGFRPFTA